MFLNTCRIVFDFYCWIRSDGIFLNSRQLDELALAVLLQDMTFYYFAKFVLQEGEVLLAFRERLSIEFIYRVLHINKCCVLYVNIFLSS